MVVYSTIISAAQH